MRFYISLYLAKICHLFLKTTNLGSGYVWPGHLALKIAPNILASKKFVFSKGVVIVSGTNGKTTTAKLITHLLTHKNYKVVHNTTGANLVNGIVSALLLNTDLFGRLHSDFGVFEVDEFALPVVLKSLEPNVLVLLNLSRDQLDRYGEVDIVLERWRAAVAELPETCTLLLDADQKKLKDLTQVFQGTSKFFDADLTAQEKTALRGEFNARNINAALLVCAQFGFDPQDLVLALAEVETAYGRGETLEYKAKKYVVFLAKNPASFNNNLSILTDFDPVNTALLFVLNDKIPDGRDVSWIYDIDPHKLDAYVRSFGTVFVAGTRAHDMAVRLSYSGLTLDTTNIDADLQAVVQKTTHLSQKIENVVVFPNYSAMLQIRKLLTGKAIL